MSAKHQLLVIDDDQALCSLLTEYLGSAGFAVETVQEPTEGVRRALSGQHAIVVLDVMLPGMDGFEALRRIRAHSQVPVLMLTARGEDVDRIVGLEIGADDYLAKPFNARELLARLNSILRRAQAEKSRAGAAGGEQTVIVGDIELDPAARFVRCGTQPVELTSTEFTLLEVFLRAVGRVVPRDELCWTVLGRKLAEFDRSIDMHVSHLRRKLGPGAGQTERIRSVRGEGYIFVAPRAPDRAAPAAREPATG